MLFFDSFGTLHESKVSAFRVWLDKGELEAIIRKVTRGPLGAWIDKLTAKD